jgi:hypothetical protein
MCIAQSPFTCFLLATTLKLALWSSSVQIAESLRIAIRASLTITGMLTLLINYNFRFFCIMFTITYLSIVIIIIIIIIFFFFFNAMLRALNCRPSRNLL